GPPGVEVLTAPEQAAQTLIQQRQEQRQQQQVVMQQQLAQAQAGAAIAANQASQIQQQENLIIQQIIQAVASCIPAGSVCHVSRAGTLSVGILQFSSGTTQVVGPIESGPCPGGPIDCLEL